ncbi:MAG: hypothetical protein V1773_00140 [bacterium]
MKNKILTISLISLFSIVLWGTISLSEEYFTTIKIPVSFLTSDDSSAISNISNEEVTISVKGQGWQLAKLSLTKNLSFAVRIKNRFGNQVVSSRSELENNPWFTTNFQLTEINPERLSFHVEKLRSKYVKIVPDIQLTYKEGFGIVDIEKLNPDTIKIFGPLSLLKDIDYIKTEFYQFENLDKKVRERLDLKPMKLIKYSTNFTTAAFDVQKIVDKVFENIKIQVEDLPVSFNLHLIPNSITIKLRGGINVLGKMTNEDLSAFVSFRTAFNDTLGYLEPIIKNPAFSSIIDIQPKKVEYIIKQN